MSVIDELQIDINAKSENAKESIDKLISKLDILTTSLSRIDGSKLTGLANGVGKLGKSVQTLNGVKSTDYSRIANGFEKFSKINYSGLSKTANGLNILARSLSGLSNVPNTGNITSVINAIKNLARVDMSGFDTGKMKAISDSIHDFSSKLSTIGKIENSVTRIVSSMARLSNSGQYISNVSIHFPKLGNQVVWLVGKLSAAKTIDLSVAKIIEGIARLASAGKKIEITVSNMDKLGDGIVNLVNRLNALPSINDNISNLIQGLGNIATSGARAGSAGNILSRSLTSFSNSAEKASKKSWSLASAIGKVYASYWILFRAFGSIRKAIDISADLTEVQNVVDVTFGNMSSKVEEFAQNSIRQFGMSELSAKQFSSRFQAMGSAMGIDPGIIGGANKYLNGVTDGYTGLSESMADVSLNLTKLTADMASFYNVSQKDVAKDLESIFTGETRPLRQYGIDLTQATLSEWAMKQGLDANVKSMSQAEKTMLRYQYVLSNTVASHGDFSRTSNTWANQLRILKQNFEQLASVIGGTFINALKPLVKSLNTAMGHVISFASTISNALGKIFGWKFEESGGGIKQDFEGIYDSIDSSSGGAGELSDNIEEAAKNAKKLKSTTLGIDELNINAPDTDSTGGGTGGSGIGTGSVAGNAGLTEGIGGQWIKGESILKSFESEIDSLFKLGEYIGNTLENAMDSIRWENIYEKARGFGKGLAEFLNGLISPSLFGKVGKTVANSLNTAIYSALEFGREFDFYEFGESIATGINEFFRNFDFKTLAKTINTWVGGIIEAIQSALKNINLKDILGGLWDLFSNLDALPLGIIALKGIKKVLPGFKKFEDKIKAIGKAWGILDKDFKRKGFTSLTPVLKEIPGKFKEIIGGFSNLQKGALTAFSVFAEFNIVSDTIHGLTEGTESFVIGIGKIAGSVGLASAAMSAAFGPAGIALGAITGIVGAMKGFGDAFKEREEIEKYGDTLSNITTRIQENSDALHARLKESSEYVETAGLAEMQMASDLSDRYFDLAEKQSLTNEEKEEMQRLASTMVEQLPGLQQYYDTESGLINTTRDSVEKLIDQKLKEIQLAAVEQELQGLYQERIQQEKALQEATKNHQDATDDLIVAQGKLKALEALRDKEALYDEWKRVSDELATASGNTDELTQKQQDLWTKLTNNGQVDISIYEGLDEAIAESETKIQGLATTWENTRDNLNNVIGDREDINSQIAEYTGMVSDGYSGAAEGAAEGFANTLANDTNMADASLQKAYKVRDTFAKKGLKINSPSKEFEDAAKFSIEGYILGLNENEELLKEETKNTATLIINTFNDTIKSGIKNVAAEITKGFSSGWQNSKNVFSDTTEFFGNTFGGAYEAVKQSFSFLDSWFQEKWMAVKSVFSETRTFFNNSFTNAYNAIKQSFSFLDEFFKGKWDSVKIVFKDTKSYFKNAFDSAYEAIKTSFSGIKGFFKGIAKDIIDPIEEAVNGTIKGMNWILKEVGSSEKVQLWTAPAFERGTNGLRSDTLGVVNDQKGSVYKELIVPPKGKPFIPDGRNVVLPLEKGTKIMPAMQTKKFINNLPKFKKGIGDFLGGFFGKYSNFTGKVTDYIMEPKKIMQIAIDKFTDTSKWDGIYRTMASGVIKRVFDSSAKFIEKIFDSTGIAVIEKAVKWALNIASDDKHGYDQSSRWGVPDYDCSSFVISAFEQAGAKLKSNGATYTGNMYGAAKSVGFADITEKINKATGYGLKRGDILLNRKNHAALYIGNGRLVQASSNEHGGITGGKPGDQTGKEISIGSYYNYPWDNILRYAKAFKNGIGKISFSDLIPKYSAGGVVEDGLFYANRKEIIGEFGNGKTAVANDFQIVSGIKQGVREAVSEILSPYLSDIAKNTRETADKDMTLKIQDRDIVNSYDRGKARNGYQLIRTI